MRRPTHLYHGTNVNVRKLKPADGFPFSDKPSVYAAASKKGANSYAVSKSSHHSRFPKSRKAGYVHKVKANDFTRIHDSHWVAHTPQNVIKTSRGKISRRQVPITRNEAIGVGALAVAGGGAYYLHKRFQNQKKTDRAATRKRRR